MKMFLKYSPKDARREGHTKDKSLMILHENLLRYGLKDAEREGHTKEVGFDDDGIDMSICKHSSEVRFREGRIIY